MPSPLPDPLATVIAAKLASGALPATLPTSIIRSAGVGHRCAACELSIAPIEIETECTFADGRWLRLHLECFREWRQQRAG
jgi:hypothetical protein